MHLQAGGNGSEVQRALTAFDALLGPREHCMEPPKYKAIHPFWIGLLVGFLFVGFVFLIP